MQAGAFCYAPRQGYTWGMWFNPILAKLIDKDILEYGEEAKMMDDQVVTLQLARAVKELADAIRKQPNT